MCRKLMFIVCSLSVLALVSNSYGVLIGDFEQQMDNFGPTSETPVPTFEYSTTGATSGDYSLAVQPNKTGWQWAFMHEGIVDIDTNPILSVDVTWVAAEWGTTPWVNFKDIAVNSDSPSGWQQYTPTDPVNPDYPGSWDPGNWGDHTRTLTWDLSDYDTTGVTWMQIIFSSNIDSNATTVGKYYIDNVQLIPEPATFGLLFLGGLVLLRRRK